MNKSTKSRGARFWVRSTQTISPAIVLQGGIAGLKMRCMQALSANQCRRIDFQAAFQFSLASRRPRRDTCELGHFSRLLRSEDRDGAISLTIV
jgi:hypothetical protein